MLEKMASGNRIKNVAVVGAGGNVGSYIANALLKTGKHTVTAITRHNSQNKLAEGIISKEIDYEKPETLVDALRGQDALVITLSGYSPIQETEEKLVRAAAEAGVPWILPNEWSPDTAHEGMVNDLFLFKPKVATRKLIEEIGKSSYIALSTGFWYEYSLAMPRNYGFDFANHTVKFYNDGEDKICTSTWPQIGRAVAALLSLPIQPEEPNTEACLEKLKNRVVYINSFNISQKDMLASALRITGTKEEDWTITKEPATQVYTTGQEHLKQGKKEAFANVLYSRIFFPDGAGNFEDSKGTLNSMLGLPKEDLDEATNIAIERQKTQADGH
ncbi:conserved hypothetical protein [Talaromyces stipitatus ATCC 10500]|uniref:NmrA-like domain-containing protein n=2 Tax=Talaromyces stipitatus TaxID=28564 RepID=B8MFY7_TALSN|nr:uncharacterized protein TSTA_009740 [Talaromyces stipitatus ATCC 10500]AWS21691.1 isoflavone reductase [Talaromyces stipitatus]EED15854.1 conserved hypothetical protein [Talaromyces stipitatus ATCC 10500]